ncbi:tetraspanin-19-like [Lolium rigidum]|uniref:tetraspanin-19-like n=1 Tax=Lolium rigidum TaxID=89674 RepID=UPI001F5C1ABB|nr:tetraspanin-19-like [Lolium rigidum]
MAGRGVARSCVQTALKAANSLVGLAGMAVILYALWMLRAWSAQAAHLHRHLPVPWFIYTLLGLGVVMCSLTCSGHIAAETANGACLSCHMIFVFLLVILEGATTADVFLNSNWEEDFPEDPSGNFAEFKEFVRSNFQICEWVGLSVVGAQALSIILAMVLKALGPEREIDYDSDDDAVPARLPLLRNQAQHGSSYVETNLPRRSDSWTLRILDKANK